MRYTGTDLQLMGFRPGPWFSRAIDVANAMEAAGKTHDAIEAQIRSMAPAPTLPLRSVFDAPPVFGNILAELPGDKTKRPAQARRESGAIH